MSRPLYQAIRSGRVVLEMDSYNAVTSVQDHGFSRSASLRARCTGLSNKLPPPTVFCIALTSPLPHV